MASKTTLANFTLPLAGFANPRYIAADPTDATGHDISDAVAVAISVISMGTNTVVAEQTFDRAGLTGWFPVLGQRVDDATAALASAFAAAKAYIFPVIGARMRFRVTALATADLVASLSMLDEAIDIAPGAGTGGTLTVAQGALSTASPTMNFRVVSAAAVFNSNVKASGGKLHGYQLHNTTAAAKYAKLFSKASAATIGTDTPIASFVIPPNGVAAYFNPIGKQFLAGITLVITGAIADGDTTVLAANDVVGHLDYI